MSIEHWPNPIHDERPNELLWSRSNLTEAIPGVATPLTWTFWEHGFAMANRDLYVSLGIFSEEEALRPQGVHPREDFFSVFYGRPVVNVDRARDVFARVPGGDPDKFELQILGSVRDGVDSSRSMRRCDEGAMNRPSWREDPAPVVAMMERYQELGSRPDGAAGAKRMDAIEQVVAAAPRGSRTVVRRLLSGAGQAVVRREITKAAFLQCIDVGRHAARALGRHLTDDGRLDDPEDVFQLTVQQASDGNLSIDKAVIAERKARWIEYHSLDVPTTFVGEPDVAVVTAAAPSVRPDQLTGIGAGAGVATGRARVITDPADGALLEPGDVLVCQTTDPAWVTMFLVASAVVVEIGGLLSHAAIVARELGVPCVVAVDGACSHLAGNPMVRVDGTLGTVDVLT